MSRVNTSTPSGKAGGYLAVLTIMYAAAFLAGFNENLVNMGLMSIMGEYGIDSITAQWLVTGYMIMATIVVMCMAFMFRRLKLRVLFLTGSVLCLAGSVLGLVAANFPMLLVARLVQAAGAGVFIPMMMNTILVVAPKNRLGTFMSIGGCMISFGPAFAPVVCGALVSAFGWHSIFTVPLVGMAILTVAGFFVLENFPTQQVSLDIPSAGLCAVFLFTLCYGLAQLTIAPIVGIVFLAIAIASAVVFCLRQGKCASPLIDLRPMASRRFWPAVVLVVVCMTIMFSLSVLLPMYFEGALGMTPFLAGIVILVPVLANTACTLWGGRVMDSKGEWPLLPAGLAITLVGSVALALVAPAASAPAAFGAALLVYIGIGLVFSPAQTAGLRTLPHEQNPFGVALMTTFVQIAACVGPSMFTGILASNQASGIAAGMEPTSALAKGFSVAILVASVFATIGFVCAFLYARAARKAQAGRMAGGHGIADHASASAHMDVADVACSEAGSLAGEGAGAGTEGGTPIASVTVASLMETDPYVLRADMPVSAAITQLLDHQVNGMPVVDAAGAVCGYLSDGDIMRSLADAHSPQFGPIALIEAANSQNMDERIAELMGQPVSAIATQSVIYLEPSTTLQEACQVLAEHRFKKLPVVQGGQVVGVITRSNILRVAMGRFIG